MMYHFPVEILQLLSLESLAWCFASYQYGKHHLKGNSDSNLFALQENAVRPFLIQANLMTFCMFIALALLIVTLIL